MNKIYSIFIYLFPCIIFLLIILFFNLNLTSFYFYFFLFFGVLFYSSSFRRWASWLLFPFTKLFWFKFLFRLALFFFCRLNLISMSPWDMTTELSTILVFHFAVFAGKLLRFNIFTLAHFCFDLLRNWNT